jgi:hypothetical protein
MHEQLDYLVNAITLEHRLSAILLRATDICCHLVPKRIFMRKTGEGSSKARPTPMQRKPLIRAGDSPFDDPMLSYDGYDLVPRRNRSRNRPRSIYMLPKIDEFCYYLISPDIKILTVQLAEIAVA